MTLSRRWSKTHARSLLSILMKKIDSLQHLIRTTAAKSHNWNSKYHKRWYYFAAHCRNVIVLRSNIIFCGICFLFCDFPAVFLVRCCKLLSFFIYICCFGTSVGPDLASSKCTSSSLGIHITLHLPAEYRPNRIIRDRVMTSYPFFKMAATASQSYFRFRFLWRRSSGKVEIYLHRTYHILVRYLNPRLRYYYFRFLKTNVRHIRILLEVPIFLPFYVCVTIRMLFCICLLNFVQIGPSATELWRHIHFLRWRLRQCNSTFGFGFRDFAHLGRSKSTCLPNFGKISQSMAEILLLPVSENKCPPL